MDARPTYPLIIDSFAGGGGASTGIELALGRSPDCAINHSADALAMHEVNHPDTIHMDSNIWDVAPIQVTKGRHVGLFWASPDCKHFSKAKGGKPLDRNIRDLAWVVVRWAEEAKPDVIILENVEEFRTWGPLYDDGKPIIELRGHTFTEWVRRLKRAGYKVQWRELRACDYGAPTIRKRFFMIARRDGLPIVWPKPTHGDPKKPDSARLIRAGKMQPWRTAAEIIDWSIPCPSIFETSAEIMEKYGVRAIRPLADATHRRIARGVVRYVMEAAKPFIVKFQSGATGHPINEPLATVTANSYVKRPGGAAPLGIVVPSRATLNHGGGEDHAPRGLDQLFRAVTASRDAHALFAPVITAAQHGGSVRAADEPIHTIAASQKDQNAVIAATMIQSGYGEREGQAPRALDIERPIGTQVGGAAKHAVIAAHLSRFTQNGVGSAADEPVDTVMAGAPKFGVVAAFLAQHNNDSRRHGGVNPGRAAEEPLATITTAGAQQAVVAAHLMRQFGESVGHDMEEPAHTDTAGVNKSAVIAANLTQFYGSNATASGGDLDDPLRTVTTSGDRDGGHAGLVSSFLTKYYGEGLPNQAIDEPVHTVTTKPRHGVVTVDIDGLTYAIADIGMRMLTPRERFRAQGFPDSYVIDRRPDGTRLSATVQGSCCGNSVPPPVARALVAANCAHLAIQTLEAAE